MLREVLTDEKPAEDMDREEYEVPAEDGRGDMDRDEPVMEGSDDEFVIKKMLKVHI